MTGVQTCALPICALHPAGGAVRARERDSDEQPAVLGLGVDLQGPDDDGRGDRPLGASQRDPGIERTELPLGTGPTRSADDGRATGRGTERGPGIGSVG